ncbi:sialyltransferase-like protein 2 isoform X1 [Durio zibethinus]|uniref:Sialyltransferase-like protein 2 isoform X1 n=1 Tax=Durio zibethinus TaxID=66656 RepID=A0A6P6B100_DURZI|nr:sialyltransferase-like protein 2 isoform X1 [Durio zibethinus]XP_022770857.1 sialyltransferase-like protein 2 isoform X1 [Durio zibethinus]XP_022770865.1 sialyltransferase-like protein 2 isoform X1 [Durio zibethinus]
MRILKLGLLLALFSGFTAILIYINEFFNHDENHQLSREDWDALQSLQSGFQKCVSANGLGLQAITGKNYCQVTLSYPSDTDSKWRDPKTGELEGLLFEFNLCEEVATWEQVRNSTTILTREFIDALPNGWEEYAWRRINKGILLNNCKNKALCVEKLSLVLPETPPYVPRQFGRCAVIGNSGDLLKTRFGKEIDSYDVVIRENGAPIENYTEYVGKKSSFRLLNRGSAKALDKVVELDETRQEVLIIKTTIHDIMNRMIREIPIRNPVYLMLGASFGSAAKGTGLKALEFALSVCDSVDMYGFTVDPGYKEWTRYFSESRKGHTPLHGRAYYQLIECLGLIKIHSPIRADPNRVVKWVPSRRTIKAARIASEKLLRRVGAGSEDLLASCSIVKKQVKRKHMSVPRLRKAAVDHQKFVKGTTMYPLEHSSGHGHLCTVPVD